MFQNFSFKKKFKFALNGIINIKIEKKFTFIYMYICTNKIYFLYSRVT